MDSPSFGSFQEIQSNFGEVFPALDDKIYDVFDFPFIFHFPFMHWRRNPLNPLFQA